MYDIRCSNKRFFKKTKRKKNCQEIKQSNSRCINCMKNCSKVRSNKRSLQCNHSHFCWKPKPVTDLWKGDKNVAAFKVLTKAASDRNDLLVSVEEKKGFLC